MCFKIFIRYFGGHDGASIMECVILIRNPVCLCLFRDCIDLVYTV